VCGQKEKGGGKTAPPPRERRGFRRRTSILGAYYELGDETKSRPVKRVVILRDCDGFRQPTEIVILVC